jgi:hypothetical protein
LCFFLPPRDNQQQRKPSNNGEKKKSQPRGSENRVESQNVGPRNWANRRFAQGRNVKKGGKRSSSHLPTWSYSDWLHMIFSFIHECFFVSPNATHLFVLSHSRCMGNNNNINLKTPSLRAWADRIDRTCCGPLNGSPVPHQPNQFIFAISRRLTSSLDQQRVAG